MMPKQESRNSQIQGLLDLDNGGTSLPYQQGNSHMKTVHKKEKLVSITFAVN